MRIVPYDGNETIEEIQALTLIIKCVPFENSYAPAFILTSPSDDYDITMDELASLMDGLEIAQTRVDNMIDYMLRQNSNHPSLFDDEDFGGEDDSGLSN